MALSSANEVYFWGQHAGEDFITVPVKIELQNVVDIAAMNRSSISALTYNRREGVFLGLRVWTPHPRSCCYQLWQTCLHLFWQTESCWSLQESKSTSHQFGSNQQTHPDCNLL